MVMLDLQRAFDTVDHGILVRKLKAIAFNYLAVRWVTSNLKQGSVLGPLVFLLIN